MSISSCFISLKKYFTRNVTVQLVYIMLLTFLGGSDRNINILM